VAERFIEKAQSLVVYNEIRHRVIARLIGDQLGLSHIDCLPHYGMPDDRSIAIGSHWMPSSSPRWFLLLTEPDAGIPIISPRRGENVAHLDGVEHMLTPHGLGVQSTGDFAGYGSEPGESTTAEVTEILDRDDTEWRSLDRNPELLSCILEIAPGEVDGWFTPRFSYHRGRR
jgi:hypothetical protein